MRAAVMESASGGHSQAADPFLAWTHERGRGAVTRESALDVGADHLVGLMNAVIEHAVPPMHQLGIRVVELDGGRAVGIAPLAGNGNHLGTMYAGTLFGLAEMLGGALFVANFDVSRLHVTVKDMQIRYRRPARTDIRAEARLDAATIERLKRAADAMGKAEFSLEAVITDADDDVVATTRGTYQLRAGGGS
jgi:thioesterase domain-containing protein